MNGGWNKGIKMPQYTGKKHWLWKGDKVGYLALHAWVARHLGTPSKCERCGTTKKRRYEWANKSRKYKRDISDWERLCVPCHRKDTYAVGEAKAWNKGIKTGLVPKTAFKKGHIPWFILQGYRSPNEAFVARR
jgi:hypothetical protein